MKYEAKVPSREVIILGNILLYVGIVGFLYFFATTKRMIDANIYYYALVAIMGWFITQLKSWARKAVIVVFSIYALGEVVGVVVSFDSSLRPQVPFMIIILRTVRILFYCSFIVLLSKKTIRHQFSTPDN